MDKTRVESIERWAERCKNMTRWEIYRTTFKSILTTRSGLLDLFLSPAGFFGIILTIGGLFGNPLLTIIGLSFPLIAVFYFATEVALLVHVNKEKSKTNDS